MTRILRLTLFAPGIVEAMLDGRQGPGITLARLMGGFWRSEKCSEARITKGEQNVGLRPEIG